jgi:hypothetical protein
MRALQALRALKWAAALAVAIVGFISPNQAHAQKVLSGDDYAMTFPKFWSNLGPDIVGKNEGIGGMGTLNATAGTSLPNLDSLAQTYADSLGGHITKDSNGTKTLGGRTVYWQQFKYDSLPRLSKQISDSLKININLKNGSFRVYYLQAEGFVFTFALLAIFPGAIPPYADAESAIATLKLGAQAGIISLSRGPGRDLWIRGGRLGGEWLKTNRVFAVDCFDSRGALIGSATHGAEGSWNLPASRQEMFVLLRTAYGKSEHFTVHPR